MNPNLMDLATSSPANLGPVPVTTSSPGIFSNNPYFSAGFGLLGVGAALAVLRQGARHAAALTKKQLLVTLEIPSRDKSYQWILAWISKQQQPQAHLGKINDIASSEGGAGGIRRRWNRFLEKKIRSATMPRHLAVQTDFKQHENGNLTADYSFVSGPGKHLFKYKNCWVQVDRVRETKMLDLVNGAPWETITLTTLNRDRTIFKSILEESQRAAIEQQDGKTVIYNSVGPEWRPFGPPRKKRNINSVVLDQNIAQDLMRDVREFINNSKWYDERGIPYRRGYLLYGPPGTGKTSFIQALAGELGYNICILNLSERGHTDDRLNHLLTIAPERSITLLEDIDAAFPVNRQSEEPGQFSRSQITFSGLLNALDGVSSAEERLVFMTTNHIERLDKALIRPGRVDYKVYLGNASKHQIIEMYIKFYPNDKNLAPIFAEKIGGRSVSPAQLQGHFVINKHSAQAAIDDVESIFST
ncbi:Mitochondrial chaperone BCS1 [Smittium mucronatum]|uniref:Mitochondrial chaperone BCS1 n=1 Tax=Smittium mucronatum TaxID=133383 RepID=A0A1R0H2P3_9FUNG|nr:Mitochondrial chaperone BCS1 [Smittium mucronatum]